MEPVKRMAGGGAWDHLPEEIVSLIAVKVAETSETPLEDLHSLRLCNKATKRSSSSHVPIASTLSITTSPWFGRVPTRSTHTSKPSTGCKVRTPEEPSSSRGWVTYARADPVVRHSSDEQKRKETYKRPTCWPCSSTTSMVQPTIFSTTSGASTVRSLLVHRSKHGGGRRTGTMTRMRHELWVFATEF
jgi:hypothetical protein